VDNDKKVELNLRNEFPPPSWDEWLKAVNDTLKGADFDKVMKTKTYEGITLQPIYRQEDMTGLDFTGSLPGTVPYTRGNDPKRFLEQGWIIAQAQSNNDLKALNRELHEELSRGLTAVNLKVGRGKIRLESPEDIATALKGIDLIAAPLFAQLDVADHELMPRLAEYLRVNGYELKDFSCGVGFDPTGEFAREGSMPMPLDELWMKFAANVQWAAKHAPNWRCISIDGTVFETAGASSSQELGFVLSTAIGYIQALTMQGLTIDQLAPLFQVRLSLGSNFFMEIAKVRAFRLAWSEMIKAFGGNEESCKIWIHGVTAHFNKSLYDVHVNILRTGTEAFAGVIGGVDSLEVGTFDSLVREPDEFSKRIARNQQIILAEEAHFGKVIDPSGGCYYIENLTSQLAKQAWSLMQELEGTGGMIKALRAGEIHTRIAAVANARIANVDKRKDIFVGVNMFANPLDKLPIPESTTASPKNAAVTLEHGSLPKLRAVMHVEDLRMQIAQAVGERVPQVFLLNMGSLDEYKARADFASAFLQVAGFGIISPMGFSTVAEAVAAARASGAKACCICSTDENYKTLVPELCAVLKDKVMILAGYPTEQIESYQAAGIDVFIHVRADLPATLRDLAVRMEVLS